MKINRLLQLLDNSRYANYFTHPGRLLLGVNLKAGKIVQPAVIGRDREVIVGPNISTNKVYEYYDTRGTHKTATEQYTTADVVFVAFLGAMLRWANRLERIVYSFIDAIKEISSTTELAAIFDFGLFSFVDNLYILNHRTSIIEVYFKQYLKRVIRGEQHIRVTTGTPDLLGITDSAWKLLSSKQTPITPAAAPPEVVLEQMLRGTAGAGSGDVKMKEQFVATLINPHMDRWIRKLHNIGRAYAQTTHRKAVYSMVPPDYTYLDYGILLSDWRPDPEAEGKKGVFFLVDTSGSISDFELQLFINEVYSIAMKYNLLGEVVWFSHGVAGVSSFEEIKGKEITVVGRGGTELAPALEYVHDRIEEEKWKDAAVVVLTDGELLDTDEVIKLGKITGGPQLLFYTRKLVELPGWEVEQFE